MSLQNRTYVKGEIRIFNKHAFGKDIILEYLGIIDAALIKLSLLNEHEKIRQIYNSEKNHLIQGIAFDDMHSYVFKKGESVRFHLFKETSHDSLDNILIEMDKLLNDVKYDGIQTSLSTKTFVFDDNKSFRLYKNEVVWANDIKTNRHSIAPNVYIEQTFKRKEEVVVKSPIDELRNHTDLIVIDNSLVGANNLIEELSYRLDDNSWQPKIKPSPASNRLIELIDEIAGHWSNRTTNNDYQNKKEVIIGLIHDEMKVSFDDDYLIASEDWIQYINEIATKIMKKILAGNGNLLDTIGE